MADAEMIPLTQQIFIKQENEEDYDGDGNNSKGEPVIEEQHSEEVLGVKKCEIWIVENHCTENKDELCSVRNSINNCDISIKKEIINETGYNCEQIQVKQETEILLPNKGVEDPIDIQKTSQDGIEAEMSNYLEKHDEVEKSQQCPPCNYEAKEVTILKKHIMAHHTGEKPHQCPHCDYKTVQVFNLKKHIMSLHTGEKPHQCPFCDYKTVQSIDLKSHINNRHIVKKKPYQCPHCTHKAKDISALENHIAARHTGNKFHQCPQCDYKTDQTFNLRKHIMARHTGEKPHHCPQCDYKAVSSSNLKTHIMSCHTAEKPHQCPFCEYRTVQNIHLKSHINNHHLEVGKRKLRQWWGGRKIDKLAMCNK